MTSGLWERIPSRVPGCQTERLGDETLVFCPSLAETIYLNDTAAVVWTLCDGVQTVRQIVTTLAQAYPEAAGRIAEDVEHTLRQLQERGVITVA